MTDGTGLLELGQRRLELGGGANDADEVVHRLLLEQRPARRSHRDVVVLRLDVIDPLHRDDVDL